MVRVCAETGLVDVKYVIAGGKEKGIDPKYIDTDCDPTMAHRCRQNTRTIRRAAPKGVGGSRPPLLSL